MQTSSPGSKCCLTHNSDVNEAELKDAKSKMKYAKPQVQELDAWHAKVESVLTLAVKHTVECRQTFRRTSVKKYIVKCSTLSRGSLLHLHQQ